MSADLNSLPEAAMKLPADERRTLINRLKLSSIPSKEPGLVERHFGAIRSGDARSCDNEVIDADLASEYLDTHEYGN